MGFQVTPSVERMIRGGGHPPTVWPDSKIAPEVTVPAYKAVTLGPPGIAGGSVTTVRLRIPISRAVATVAPASSTVVSEFGDWNTRSHALVDGVYCQIAACSGRR